MAVTRTNDYNIATNADLGNVLNNVDLNRIGTDLTALELDGGTVKVSVGSIIESQGSLYKVDTAAVTPTGTATAGAYLFFDDAVPGFVWSATAGTYDPARGGIYDVSNRRQCRFYLTSATEWLQVAAQDEVIFESTVNMTDLEVSGAINSPGTTTLDDIACENIDFNAVASGGVFTANDFSGTMANGTTQSVQIQFSATSAATLVLVAVTGYGSALFMVSSHTNPPTLSIVHSSGGAFAVSSATGINIFTIGTSPADTRVRNSTGSSQDVSFGRFRV